MFHDRGFGGAFREQQYMFSFFRNLRGAQKKTCRQIRIS